MSEFARPIDIKENGKVQYGDSGVIAEFSIRPLLMEALSKDRGYPVHEDRIFLRIVYPGNTKTVYEQPAKGITYLYDEEGDLSGYEVQDLETEPADANKYPQAWARFEKKGEKVKDGWSIMEWGAITRSFAESLKALNIHTVEALAQMSDANVTNIMGGLKFRNLAKAALDEQELLRLASHEQEKAAKSDEENKELKKQMAAMQAQINSLSKKQAAA